MSQLTKSRISLENLSENFEEVYPGLTSQEAVEESNRCLYCYDAPCITACPTGIDNSKDNDTVMMHRVLRRVRLELIFQLSSKKLHQVI